MGSVARPGGKPDPGSANCKRSPPGAAPPQSHSNSPHLAGRSSKPPKQAQQAAGQRAGCQADQHPARSQLRQAWVERGFMKPPATACRRLLCRGACLGLPAGSPGPDSPHLRNFGPQQRHDGQRQGGGGRTAAAACLPSTLCQLLHQAVEQLKQNDAWGKGEAHRNTGCSALHTLAGAAACPSPAPAAHPALASGCCCTATWRSPMARPPLA